MFALATRELELRATTAELAAIALEVRRRVAHLDERVTLLQNERLTGERELRDKIAALEARLTTLQARSHDGPSQ